MADLPSRGALREMLDILATFEGVDVEHDHEMVIPPFDAWDAPFSLWLEHVAVAAAEDAEEGARKRRRR